MSEETSRPNEMLHIYQNMFRTPESFMPSSQFAQTLTEASRGIMAAQVSYMQAIMSANAKLMEAFLGQHAPAPTQHIVEPESTPA